MRGLYIVLLIFLGLILVLLLAYLLTCNHVFNNLFARHGKLRKNFRNVYEQSIEEGKKYFNNNNFEKIKILSEDGFFLTGYYKNKNSRNLLILIHGYGADHNQTGSYAKMFEQILDCDLLCIDLRNHGESEGEYSSFGKLEKIDLQCWTDEMKQKNHNYKIFLFGLGLGASIALSQENDSDIIGVIADSAFDNAYKHIKFLFHKSKYNFKLIFKLLINYLLKNKKINLKEIDICKKLNNTKTKTLIIHGENDELIAKEMALNIYSSLPENKRDIEIFKDAYHCNGLSQNRFNYQNKIKYFLKNII